MLNINVSYEYCRNKTKHVACLLLSEKSYNTECGDKSECITEFAECQSNLCQCSDQKYFNGVSCEDSMFFFCY